MKKTGLSKWEITFLAVVLLLIWVLKAAAWFNEPTEQELKQDHQHRSSVGYI